MIPAQPAWLENLCALYGFSVHWEVRSKQWMMFCGKRPGDVGDEWVVAFEPTMTLHELVKILKQRGITHGT